MSVEAFLKLPRRARVSFQPATEKGAEPAGRWESKLGGAPYLPRDAQWPRRSDDAVPLGFVAQINLGELERWHPKEGAPEVLDGHLPTTGILQFFLPLEEVFGLGGSNELFLDAPCVYWPDVDEAALSQPQVAIRDEATGTVVMVDEVGELEHDGDHISTRDGGGNYTPLSQPRVPVRLVPVREQPELQLPDPQHVDVPEDCQVAVYGLPRDEQERVQAEIGYGGFQLGGHPMFAQDDPRPSSDLVLLLQLDMGSSQVVWLGDLGTMGFFIHKDDLAAQRFDRVVMAWNCS